MAATATPPTGSQIPSPDAGLAVAGGRPVSSAPVPFMSVGLSEADIDAATTVLRSGMLRAAKKCAELEQRFAAVSGARHALTCANGTCALQLAYGAMLKPGDHVIVPAWTYIATVSMVVAAGCTPIFADALPDTYQIDVADAERRLTPRTTAIACTHLYGMRWMSARSRIWRAGSAGHLRRGPGPSGHLRRQGSGASATP